MYWQAFYLAPFLFYITSVAACVVSSASRGHPHPHPHRWLHCCMCKEGERERERRMPRHQNCRTRRNTTTTFLARAHVDRGGGKHTRHALSPLSHTTTTTTPTSLPPCTFLRYGRHREQGRPVRSGEQQQRQRQEQRRRRRRPWRDGFGRRDRAHDAVLCRWRYTVAALGSQAS